MPATHEDQNLTIAVDALWRDLSRFIEPIGKFTVGHSAYEDEENAKAAIRRALATSAALADRAGTSMDRAEIIVSRIESEARCSFGEQQRRQVVDLIGRLASTPVLNLKPVSADIAAEAKRLARHLRGRAGGDTVRTYTDRMAVDDTDAAQVLDGIASVFELLELATIAKERLLRFADEVNAGHVQGGGREFSRKVSGAFSDFDDALASIGRTPPEESPTP